MVKAERLAELQALLRAQQLEFNQAAVGRVLPVLFEKPGRHAGQLIGRTPHLHPVHAAVDAGEVGTVVPVRIDAVQGNSLAGTTIEARAA
jgi:tRNA-2-methylthio-N6-dimethylallyladenosine synthase